MKTEGWIINGNMLTKVYRQSDGWYFEGSGEYKVTSLHPPYRIAAFYIVYPNYWEAWGESRKQNPLDIDRNHDNAKDTFRNS